VRRLTYVGNKSPIRAGFDLEAIWDEEWEKNLLTAALERIKRQVDPEQFQIFDLYCLEQWPAKGPDS